jgi:hypothetical protein
VIILFVVVYILAIVVSVSKMWTVPHG